MKGVPFAMSMPAQILQNPYTYSYPAVMLPVGAPAGAPNQAPLTQHQEGPPHLSSDTYKRSDQPPQDPSGKYLAVQGEYALQDQPASFAATMNVGRDASNPLTKHIQFGITPNTSTHVLNQYDPATLKKAQFFIVSDDFTSFQIVHPTLKNGVFSLSETFPRPGVYYVYADVTPQGEAHEAFHFDIPVDVINQQTEARQDATSNLIQKSGLYTIRINKNAIQTDKDTIEVTITNEDGKPSPTKVQAILLNPKNLSYARSLSEASPHANTLDLPVQLAQQGSYRMWILFNDGQSEHIVSYQIVAS